MSELDSLSLPPNKKEVLPPSPDAPKISILSDNKIVNPESSASPSALSVSGTTSPTVTLTSDKKSDLVVAKVSQASSSDPIAASTKKKKKKGVGFAMPGPAEDVDSAKKGVGFAISGTAEGSAKKGVGFAMPGPEEGSAKKGVGFAVVADDFISRKNPKSLGLNTADLEVGDHEPGRVAATPAAVGAEEGTHSGTKIASFSSLENGRGSTRFNFPEPSPLTPQAKQRQESAAFTEPTSQSVISLYEEKDVITGLTYKQVNTEEISQSKEASLASSAQFRRMERSNRRYSIACDIWCGIEVVNNIYLGPVRLVFTNLALPLIACVVAYSSWSLNDSNDTANKAMHILSFALTVAAQSFLVVEMYSNLVCEVEYGVVVLEEIPLLYLGSATCGVALAVIVQVILFAVYEPYFGESTDSSHDRWVWLLLGGCVGTSLAVAYSFIRYAPHMLTRELQGTFVRFLAGSGYCLLLLPLMYAFYAAAMATWGGAMGILLALMYPIIGLMSKVFVANYLLWGDGKGELFTGPILDILVESAHAGFLCVAAIATTGTSTQLAVLLVAQSLYYFYLAICLQSSSITNISMFDAQNFCGCIADSRIDIKDSPASSPSKYQVTEEAVFTDNKTSDEITGNISAEIVEGFSFEKQCSKLRDIISFSCSIIIGVATTSVVTLFAALVSQHRNSGSFESYTDENLLWSLAINNGEGSMTSSFRHLLVLLGYQILVLALVFFWLISNGNFLGLLQNHLLFYFSNILTATAVFTSLVTLGTILRGNGFNASFK